MAGLFQKSPLKKEDSYRELLDRAQSGEAEAREQLISRYTPFVLRVLSQKTGRFYRLGEDDEVSIGLIALNEAINSFDPKKSSNFLTYAETTIKSRLIDFYRKESRFSKVVPISALESEDEENQDRMSQLTAKQAMAEFQAKGEATERKDEILAYAQVLKEYGISFAELVEISPKHEDARRRAVEAAYLVAESPDLRAHLMSKKELPLKVLTEMVDVSRKTLERQRKYIIAIVLVLVYEFSHLREYVKAI